MMYANEPRKSRPDIGAWYYVETPAVFFEAFLYNDDDRMTRQMRRDYTKLKRLADATGSPIRASSYRRG